MNKSINTNMHNLAANPSMTNSKSRNISRIDIKNRAINSDYTLTSKDIIRKINPVVIPRVSSLASMAL